MTVLDRSNNNKPGSDPSVPSDLSTLSSCHTPSQDSDGTCTKRHLTGKSALNPHHLESSVDRSGRSMQELPQSLVCVLEIYQH